MQFHSAHLIEDSPCEEQDCMIRSDSPLVDILRKTASSGHPYLFVENDDGAPVGLLAAEDVLKRVTDPHPTALLRWMNMTADAALQSRIEVPSDTGEPLTDDTEITKVTRNGTLIGVMTNDDVMVSWRSVQKTLSNYQGDAVTGLPNRATFDHQLEAEINRASRCGHSVGVLLIDLDHFKQINDNFGHSAGDSALHLFASRLRATLRSYDFVARFGGDEFAVICSGCRPGEIDIVLTRLREAVLKPGHGYPAEIPIPTISVGACVVHDMCDGRHPTQILEAADECLYAAKRFGRNCTFKIESEADDMGQPAFVDDRAADQTEGRQFSESRARC